MRKKVRESFFFRGKTFFWIEIRFREEKKKTEAKEENSIIELAFLTVQVER